MNTEKIYLGSLGCDLMQIRIATGQLVTMFLFKNSDFALISVLEFRLCLGFIANNHRFDMLSGIEDLPFLRSYLFFEQTEDTR